MDRMNMDKALQMAWLTVSQNTNTSRLLMMRRGISEQTRVRMAQIDEMMHALLHVNGLVTDTYSVGYLRPAKDMTVCRVEVRPEAMPEVLMRLSSINDMLLSLIAGLLAEESE